VYKVGFWCIFMNLMIWINIRISWIFMCGGEFNWGVEVEVLGREIGNKREYIM
jgi:hypothetical protein